MLSRACICGGARPANEYRMPSLVAGRWFLVYFDDLIFYGQKCLRDKIQWVKSDDGGMLQIPPSVVSLSRCAAVPCCRYVEKLSRLMTCRGRAGVSGFGLPVLNRCTTESMLTHSMLVFVRHGSNQYQLLKPNIRSNISNLIERKF